MGLIDRFLGTGNPAKAGAPYLAEIPRYGNEAYLPYRQVGRNAEDALTNELNYMRDRPNREMTPVAGAHPASMQMANNPLDYLNKILGSYKPSEGYKYRESQLLKGAGNTAAAGGFAGTQNDIAERAALVNSLMSGDMQEFLSNVLGIQGMGLEANENYLDRLFNREEQYANRGQQKYLSGVAGTNEQANRGFVGSSALADYLGGNMGAQAGLQFQGNASQNANTAALVNSLMQAISGGAGAYYGHKAGSAGGSNFNRNQQYAHNTPLTAFGR